MIGPRFRWIAILGLLIAYIWPRYLYFSVAGKGVSAYTFFSMLMLASAAAVLVLEPDIRYQTTRALARSKIVIGIFALFWAWRLVCDILGATPAPSLFQTLLDFNYLGGWTLSCVVFFADFRLRALLPWIILVSGVVATIAGIIEWQTHVSVPSMLGLYDFASGDQIVLRQIKDVLKRGDIVRVRSLYSHPLVYGQVVAAMTPAALHFIVQGDIKRRIAGAVFAGCIAVSLGLCNARSPLFVATASGVVYFALFYFDPKRISRLFVLLWALLALVIVAPIATGQFIQLTQGRTSDEAMSSAARKRQNEQGTKALENSPILGFGDGNSGTYAGIIGERGILTVDDYFLTVSVDEGYGGLAIFILMLTSFALKGLALSYDERETQSRSRNCMATGTIVGLSVGLKVLSIVDPLSFVFTMAGYLIAMSGVSPPGVISRFGRRGETFLFDENPAGSRGT